MDSRNFSSASLNISSAVFLCDASSFSLDATWYTFPRSNACWPHAIVDS